MKHTVRQNCTHNDTYLPPHGIIISYEGLASPILESQLLEHADALLRKGVRTEVWILNGTSKLYKQSKNELEVLQSRHNTKILLLRSVWHNLPFSEYFNALIIKIYIRKRRFKPLWIHARTEYAGAVCAILKKYLSFRLVFDVRGDTVSEILFLLQSRSLINKIFMRIKVLLTKNRIKASHKKTDAAIFVSKELHKIHAENGFNAPYMIVPCVANPSLFFYNHKIRMEMRQNLGYSMDDIVVCYSGSTAAWQCSSETIKMICEMMKESKNVRGLILSKEVEYFKGLVESRFLNNFRFFSVEFNRMNDYLNIADFAFLLRNSNSLNYVASPVKFAEYSLTGLQVITTKAVAQVIDYGSLMKNIIVLENVETKLAKKLFVNDGEERAAVSQAALQFYDRNNYLERCLYLYGM